MTIVKVALDVPVSRLFDYRLDDASPVEEGVQVQVPFGRRQLIGLVLEITDRSDVEPHKLRRVTRVLRDVPPLSAEVRELIRFCSEYYHHPIGEAVMTALPSRLRSGNTVRARHAHGYRSTATGVEQAANLAIRAVALRRIWQRCHPYLDADEVSALTTSERRSLRNLLTRGWVETCDKRPTADHIANTMASGPPLNAEQRNVVDTILQGSGTFGAWMLHGVTGSGKTEVYFHLMEAVLRNDGQVLLLVPEINLTPQLELRIRSRFPQTRLVCLHSGLADGERASNWLAAQVGDARIILGTRSAVFAPLPRLRLIVVDEEHDSSFKQMEGMRYHARDLAVWRARAHGIPVVLGSATPSLETWQHASTGRYRTVRLVRRANAADLPAIHLVSARGRRPDEGLAPQLVTALRACIARNEQCLVFINRRGYAPTLLCHSCHWIAACQRCSAKLVLHAQRRRLVCHHCGHSEHVMATCPDCGDLDLRPLGHGTQRIEERLQGMIPHARLLRVDRDSTSRRNAWREMHERIARREVDILVGTQLMAKGHDFPGLSLVCVLDVDRALFSTDYRASEHLFAQLMQVAGRAGRSTSAGMVLVQTEFPEHPIFQHLCTHDYAGFASNLLRERQTAGFPPFVYQAVLRAEASQAELVFEFLRSAATLGHELAGDTVLVFDPAPAVMHRLKGQERGQLLVQSEGRPSLHRFLDKWLQPLRERRVTDVRWILDVDPLEV